MSNPIIEGMQEALSVARGEQPAASIWHNGHRYVSEAEHDVRSRAVADLSKQLFELAEEHARLRKELDEARAMALEEAALVAERGIPSEIDPIFDDLSALAAWGQAETVAAAIRRLKEIKP